MKDLAILNLQLVFIILSSLRKPQQIICSCICLALAIINLKMVSQEPLGLADLSRAQTLCIYETTEVIMGYKDENLMLAAF